MLWGRGARVRVYNYNCRIKLIKTEEKKETRNWGSPGRALRWPSFEGRHFSVLLEARGRKLRKDVGVKIEPLHGCCFRFSVFAISIPRLRTHAGGVASSRLVRRLVLSLLFIVVVVVVFAFVFGFGVHPISISMMPCACSA